MNCFAYAGWTNTSLDLGSFRQGQFKCECVTLELDRGKPTETKWGLV